MTEIVDAAVGIVSLGIIANLAGKFIDKDKPACNHKKSKRCLSKETKDIWEI